MTYRARRSLVLSLLSATLFLNGCGILLPKQVELFQRKVKAVPEISDSAKETQRQAAERIADETLAAQLKAELEQASTNVTVPLHDANTVANGLSTSLGPPAKPYRGSADDLAQDLKHDKAKLNAKVDAYADKVQKDVGKKIEGTGFFKFGYFTMWGILLGVVALIWFGLKVYGMFNPLVGTGTGIAERVSGAVLHKGFSEVVQGGQQFLQWVNESQLEQNVKDWIQNTFVIAHQTAQSPDVQAVVDKVITKPITSAVAPSAAPKA